MHELILYGTILKNIRIYTEARKLGFDYILNPTNGELHRVSLDGFFGSHNLVFADLENFIGLTNISEVPAHILFDGTELPIWDLITGLHVGTYKLNKCRHCYPDLT